MSDDDISSDFNLVDIASGGASVPSTNSCVQECSASAIQSNTPCDIERIEIDTIPAATKTLYRYRNGRFQVQQPATRNPLILPPIPNGNIVFKMVAPRRRRNRNASNAKVRVMMSLPNVCTPEHPVITVSRGGVDDVLIRGRQNTQHYEFDVWRRSNVENSRADWLLERYWTMHLGSKNWLLDFDSCGIPLEGSLQIPRNTQVKVRVYPDDQYALRISIPPFSRIRHSRSGSVNTSGEATSSRSHSETHGGRTTGSSSTQTSDGSSVTNSSSETRTNDDGSTVTTTNETRSDFSSGETNNTTTRREQSGSLEITETQRSDGTDVPTQLRTRLPANQINVILLRNDQELASSESISKILHNLTELQQLISDFNALLESVPRIGVGFEFNLRFFSGKMEFAWGWREHTDHSVFLAWSCGVNLKVIDADIAFTCGIRAGVAAAELKCVLKGSSSVEFETAHTRPNQSFFPNQSSASTIQTIVAEIKVEARAGIENYSFSVEMGARTGIDVNSGLKHSRRRGFYLHSKFEWTGIEVFYVTQGPGDIGTSPSSDVYRVLDGHTIYEGDFPSNQ